MANCVCFNCKRPMDCTGETLCDLCEYDKERVAEANENKEFVWLSQCCDAHIYGEFFTPYPEDELSGFCGQCLDITVFYKVFF
jgi:hypothetical protein